MNRPEVIDIKQTPTNLLLRSPAPPWICTLFSPFFVHFPMIFCDLLLVLISNPNERPPNSQYKHLCTWYVIPASFTFWSDVWTWREKKSKANITSHTMSRQSTTTYDYWFSTMRLWFHKLWPLFLFSDKSKVWSTQTDPSIIKGANLNKDARRYKLWSI